MTSKKRLILSYGILALLLAEFKAVQSGSVWCTTQSFFQQSTALVDFVLDLHRVFTEDDPADLQFLRKVE